MAKDLIIGGASNYSWNQLRYWVNSIKQTGFAGDIVLVGSNLTQDTIQTLESHGVKVVTFTPINRLPPHVERFRHIWAYLKRNEDYRYVIVTDTRDVIFQKNPIDFLSSKLITNKTIVTSSEGLRYKDEPWGSQNLFDAFGEEVFSELNELLIYNVGTIAGYFSEVRDLMLQLYVLSIGRPIPIVDQAVFNFLVSTSPYEDTVLRTTNETGWAVQLGTTIGAVTSGHGDIGQAVLSGALSLEIYEKLYQDVQPLVNADYITNNHSPFYIVHQWDRVPAIKQIIESKYGDNKTEEYITIIT